LDIRSFLLGFFAGLVVILSVVFYLAHLLGGSSAESDDQGFERLEGLEGLSKSGQLSPSGFDCRPDPVENEVLTTNAQS
jgi:hypothetical protein